MRPVLLHTSGEQLVGELPIRGNDPQAIGSAITYAGTCSLRWSGTNTDDDEDDNYRHHLARNPRPNPVDPSHPHASPTGFPNVATDMARMADRRSTTHHEPITDATDLDVCSSSPPGMEAHKQKVAGHEHAEGGGA